MKHVLSKVNTKSHHDLVLSSPISTESRLMAEFDPLANIGTIPVQERHRFDVERLSYLSKIGRVTAAD